MGRPDRARGVLDATIFAAGALTVLAGVTTTGTRIGGATTAGVRIAGLVEVDLCGPGAVVVACGAGSGVGRVAAPEVGAFWGARSGPWLRVAPVADAAADELETSKTATTIAQMRAAQETASDCPRRRRTPHERVSNGPSIFSVLLAKPNHTPHAFLNQRSDLPAVCVHITVSATNTAAATSSSATAAGSLDARGPSARASATPIGGSAWSLAAACRDRRGLDVTTNSTEG